jgi:hypothetical protein
MLDRAAQAGVAAEGVAQQVRLAEPEVIDQRGDVVAEVLVPELPVDVRGAAVPLQFDGDDPAVPRQLVEQIAEHAGQAVAARRPETTPSGTSLG